MFANEEELSRAVDRLSIDAEPGAAHREALRREVLKAFERSGAEQYRPAPRKRGRWPWRSIMQHRSVQMAAACVAAACVIGLVVWWIPGGGAGIALADVQKRIQSAKTICYKLSSYRDGKPEGTAEVKYMPPGRMRSEWPGAVAIFDWEKGHILALMTEAKLAHFGAISDMENPYHQNWLEDLKKIAGSDSAQQVGEREISGRRAKGWRVAEDDTVITIWADVKTAAVLEAQFDVANTRMVMSDFRFDEELDESLFSLTPPKDYHLTPRVDMQTSDPSEQDILMLLRIWAMGNQDVFPDSLDAREFSKAADRVDWRRLGIKSKEEGADVSRAIGRAFFLLNTWGYEWSYVGKGVRLGEADKPVFWHRRKGSPNYRVIYGDLSVKKVAPEALPKPAETQPAPSEG